MTTLRYKDFQGCVEYIDGLLLVQILHIDDVITTQVDSALGAQSAFEELVDDYLSTCREAGTEPCKPFKGSFNVRVSPDLHRQVAMAAAEEGTSMNAWLQSALEAKLERRKTQEHLALMGVYLRAITQSRTPTQYSVMTRPVRLTRTTQRIDPAPIAGWMASAPRRQAN